jgi:phage terminase large subunit
MQLSVFKHQAEFLADTTTRNLALIGGYGCGKTKALALKLIILAMLNPGCIGIALSPTYKMAIQNLVPTLEEELREHNIRFNFNKSEMRFTVKVPGGETTIHVLAAEHYKRAAGLNAAFFGFDEADLLSTEIFLAAWKMMSSRLRKGKVFQGFAVSTPEGYRGCWRHWVDDVQNQPTLASSRRMIRASTYDNFTLPPEYIADLEAQYPPNLIKAYLHGEFVNLKGTPVYYRYNPAYDAEDNSGRIVSGNWTRKTVDSFPNHPLHIGLDFGKDNNPCEIHVVQGDYRYCLDEIYGLKNTDECIAEIKRRYPDRQKYFYPDANGFEAIQNYERHFGSAAVFYNPANPRVSKRVAALHWSIQNPLTKVRHFLINPERCKHLDRGLTQQVLNEKNEPDKAAGIEHANDGAGYVHVWNWPVDESSLDRQSLRL